MPARASMRVETVTVCCPSCGAAQGNHRNHSHIWTLEEVVEVAQGPACGVVECAECGKSFIVTTPPRIKAEFFV